MIYASDTLQKNSNNGLPNISDRPVIESRNVDIFANALYWHASEGIDWAFTITIEQNLETVDFKTFSFGWDPGFRVGIGYNMEYDQWDIQAYYTWFSTEEKATTSGDITSPFLGSKVALYTSYQAAKIDWKIRFNIIDLDLGRSFLVSHFLSLRPFVGIKGGWIDQTIHTKWQNPLILGVRNFLTASENIKNNFGGGGPKVGINGKWILGNSGNNYFSLFGDFAAAYMWGNWTIRDQFIGILSTASIEVGSRNLGAFMLQGLIGIRFDCNFDKDRSHFSMKIGYELEDWFNQYQVFDNLTGGQNNDLILQGLTVDLRFDF